MSGDVSVPDMRQVFEQSMPRLYSAGVLPKNSFVAADFEA
jgi:hypothetical protein